MDLSGIIFVALAVAWAVYLIPQALKRHDEAARSRSVDRFSSTMRVLAPARPARDPEVAPSQARLRAQVRTRIPTRAAARAAAARRRRVLFVLLGLTVLTAAVVGVLRLSAGTGPWWSVAIPGGLVLTWLVVCRLQVRRLDRVRNPRYEGRLVSPDEEDTVQLDVEALRAAVAAPGQVVAAVVPAVEQGQEQGAEAGSSLSGSSLWDPLPVTLPTYVTKPRAQRTVRTIDLSQPGVQSSGRSAEDSQLVAEADKAAKAETAAAEQVERRAAGG
ncbi:divisome protein SepX/GlpR [Nocardioides massiliensis]|uniref:Uncharacterized protein n=1 Tax=Nocardioides massiliensis TaxID=1325935 RepID=A0ABT9NKA4_9ACTN|nr:hypothetical protein [Nocardioides massiliensis]MDP9820280.1 hypothetical protein [Nocardioides massiliensis]